MLLLGLLFIFLCFIQLIIFLGNSKKLSFVIVQLLLQIEHFVGLTHNFSHKFLGFLAVLGGPGVGGVRLG